MQDNGYSDEAIKALWDVMLPFSGYAFNKSHTAGYGLVSYWTAYLKANYPAEYMAALLTSVGDDKDKAAIYLADAPQDGHPGAAAGRQRVRRRLRRGRRRRPVRPAARCATSVTNVIEARRRRPARPRAVTPPSTTSSTRSASPRLQQAGRRIPDQGRRLRLARAHPQGPVRRPRAGHRRGHPDQEARGPRPGRPVRRTGRRRSDDGPAFGLDFPIDDGEWPRKQLLATEREMLGLYVSAHPLDGTEHILARNRDTTIAELLDSGRTEGDVQLVRPDHRRRPQVTKQGNAWAIVTLADRDGAIEVLFFPAAYQLVAARPGRGQRGLRAGAASRTVTAP